MDTNFLSLSGFILMFVLGLRHGLDPDHIACIDGLTWHALDHEPRLAPWVGSLFAVGHGLLVTAIAVGVSQLSQSVSVPPLVAEVFGWIPTALLVLVGALNLRMLLRRDTDYQPTGWKMRLLPARLRSATNPLGIIVVGVLFASVFDTATQASAWGYVATHNGGAVAAFVAGLVFTLGMIITDTADGRLLCRLMRRADGQAAARQWRRRLGWAIVALSWSVAGYNIAKGLMPSLTLSDVAWSLVGLGLLCGVLVPLAWFSRINRAHT
jgi:nickel/cobalt transporter (NiCoT) family protein